MLKTEKEIRYDKVSLASNVTILYLCLLTILLENLSLTFSITQLMEFYFAYDLLVSIIEFGF